MLRQSESLHHQSRDMNMLLWHRNFFNTGYHIHRLHLEVAFLTQIYQNMSRETMKSNSCRGFLGVSSDVIFNSVLLWHGFMCRHSNSL